MQKATEMPGSFQNFINGRWTSAAGGKKFSSINPADTRDVIGEFASADLEDVRRAIDAAHAAVVLVRLDSAEFLVARTAGNVHAHAAHKAEAERAMSGFLAAWVPSDVAARATRRLAGRSRSL
jgi:acyl-CoA reductase-like NAD-dependent aldehyde dehydrogenase